VKQLLKITAGVLTKNGIHSLNDPHFVEPFRKRQLECAEREEEKNAKRKKRSNKLGTAIKAIQDKWGDEKTHFFQESDRKECDAYLQYKKKDKGYPAMPKDLPARKQHCIEWMIHPSPVASPCQSDDEGEVGIGEGEQGTVQGCLGWQHSSQTTGMMNVTGGIFRFVLHEKT
jgi:hypothetical protein